VQSVTPHGAKLTVVAGTAQIAQTNWRAWPAEKATLKP